MCSTTARRLAQKPPYAVVFKAMAEVSGKSFVVDSSKLPGRLSYLTTLKDLDVYPVHLVREPKGQINSVVRKQAASSSISSAMS